MSLNKFRDITSLVSKNPIQLYGIKSFQGRFSLNCEKLTKYLSPPSLLKQFN